jgi:hypothetical protein
MKRSLMLVVSVAGSCLLGACGGGSSGSVGTSGLGTGGNPPPTATISESAQTINAGQSVTLTWSSTNATSCTASSNPSESDWSGSEMTSGSRSVTPGVIGTVTYTLTCTGVGGNGSGVASLTVKSTALKITSGRLPTGIVGSRYSPHCTIGLPFCRQIEFGFQLTASGGTQPYVWSWTAAAGSSLPPGVALSSAGMVSGKPALAGTYDVVVVVSDSASPVAQASASYSLPVRNPPPPAIHAVPPAAGVNLPYDFAFTATGGLAPLSWSESGAPPPGLVFSTGGVLSGTPTATGSFPITVTVEDALLQSSGPQNFTIQIFLHGFRATGSMETARLAHTATLLNNGKVLVTGGLDGTGNPSNTAELFDPASETFAPTGSMQTPRVWHTATLLNNGKVLVTGGGFAGSATAELFDPTSGSFTPTGSMHTARSSHTATLLQDGKVLVTGGSTATAELFDPASGTFALTGSTDTARTFQTATLLKDGKVLLAGGFGPDGTALATAELFDEASGTFAPTGSMATPRIAHTATLLNGGKVLLTGGLDATRSSGATAELFNPADGSFSPTGSMATLRQLHTATLLSDGTVLVAGGLNASGSVVAAELFDPTTGSFMPTGSMTSMRASHTATLLGNGTVLMTGGRNDNGGAQFSSESYQ